MWKFQDHVDVLLRYMILKRYSEHETIMLAIVKAPRLPGLITLRPLQYLVAQGF